MPGKVQKKTITFEKCASFSCHPVVRSLYLANLSRRKQYDLSQLNVNHAESVLQELPISVLQIDNGRFQFFTAFEAVAIAIQFPTLKMRLDMHNEKRKEIERSLEEAQEAATMDSRKRGEEERGARTEEEAEERMLRNERVGRVAWDRNTATIAAQERAGKERKRKNEEPTIAESAARRENMERSRTARTKVQRLKRLTKERRCSRSG